MAAAAVHQQAVNPVMSLACQSFVMNIYFWTSIHIFLNNQWRIRVYTCFTISVVFSVVVTPVVWQAVVSTNATSTNNRGFTVDADKDQYDLELPLKQIFESNDVYSLLFVVKKFGWNELWKQILFIYILTVVVWETQNTIINTCTNTSVPKEKRWV